MKYLTSKETAEKWGLSLRSIQNYCSNGKIPGAQNLGKQWIIPIDAVPPSDSRYKSSRCGNSNSSDSKCNGSMYNADAYLFPLFIYSPLYTFGNDLNPQEYTLFSAQLKMLEGENTESIRLCREVLKYKAPLHLIMGAYYLIAHCSIILGNYNEFKKAVTAMEENIPPDDDLHLEDYKLLLNAIKRIIGWNHRLLDEVDASKLSSDALYFYQYECLLSVAIEDKHLSLDALHIIDAVVPQISLEGIAPLESNIRFAIAALHFSSADSSAEAHVDTACKIAVSHNWFSIIAKNFSLAKMPIKKSLDRLGPDYYKKTAKMADRDYNNWRLVNRQASGVYPYENFSQSDISVLYMLSQGLSNCEICTVMDLSSKDLLNILRDCYKTANVKNRHELKKYAISQQTTWDTSLK